MSESPPGAPPSITPLFHGFGCVRGRIFYANSGLLATLFRVFHGDRGAPLAANACLN
jgi:hypothetical protein